MDNILRDLEKFNFDKQLLKIKRKCQNKKVVIYGVGKVYQIIKTNYDLEGINIIGASDKKFENQEDIVFSEELNLNTVSPLKINKLKPDLVLLTMQTDYFAEKYFHEVLFKSIKPFKYMPIFNLPVSEKIRREWAETFGNQ